MSTVARYEAIGSGAFQTQVRVAPWRLRASRRPLATTCRPAGAGTTKVEGALSSGWSVSGNQVGPPRRDLGLAGQGGPVVGVDEAGLDGEAGADHQLLGDGDAVVADHGGEPVALGQPAGRGDGELVLGPRPAGGAAVDLDRPDGQADGG